MRLLALSASLVLLAACEIGEDPAAKKPKPPVTPPPAEAPKLGGAAEKPPVMEAPKPKPAPAPDAHKAPSGPAGKTAVAASFACPLEGCTVTFPSKGACLKHADTQMKEQWFVCEKDSAKEPVAGKCAKCGADLKRVLQ